MTQNTTVTFTDIKWDTDGEKVDLPNEVTINLNELDPEIDFAMDGADVLSDRYGWCVEGFNFKLNP